MRRALLGSLWAISCAMWGGTASAHEPAADAANTETAPPTRASWRFKRADRPIKVMIVAGSVGNFQRNGYPKRLQQMCSNIEVKNLSETGAGAFQLKKRFRAQVVKNYNVKLSDTSVEYWMMFGGGLNSVAMPESTNRHLRDLFLLAHTHNVKVVALSLLPWGDESDKRRWGGASGFHYLTSTRVVVDFVMGRGTPDAALGSHISRRPDPSAPWQPGELPDISVNLYDSGLRDRYATPRDEDLMRTKLAKDSKWKRAHADLSDTLRDAALARDAVIAADIPRWYMKREYRAFDHSHPNTDGHAVIAATVCRELPTNWGCSCPAP